MPYEKIIRELKSRSDPKRAKSMARFGISPENTFGIPMPVLRAMAKKIGKDHKLARNLWKSGIHEAKILASLVDDPENVTKNQMEKWVKGFDSWDVCDQVCMNLFDKTPFAFAKAKQWSRRKGEFVRRAGFALMASLAVHDKRSPDSKFEAFFPVIKKRSDDERNYVKKAVSWALRQIGKRNKTLNKKAISVAREIKRMDSRSAGWIASEALKELEGEKAKERPGKRK